MARKAIKDMTATEKIESINRQMEKLQTTLEEAHAQECCRLLVTAFANGEAMNQAEVNAAFEHASKVFCPDDFKADLLCEDEDIMGTALENHKAKQEPTPEPETEPEAAPDEPPAMQRAREQSKAANA